MPVRRNIDILLLDGHASDAILTNDAFSCGQLQPVIHDIGLASARPFLRRESGFGSAPRPDMVLIDVSLEYERSLALISDLKKAPGNLSSVPIIVFTRVTDEVEIDACYKRKVNCCVVKPEDRDEYMRAVGRIESFWFQVASLPELLGSSDLQPKAGAI